MQFDILIIGGGINGAAIARDAALRGYTVALFEKGDFASGTTQYSTRLIHGGLRYLEQFDLKLVFEALQERENLLKIAPHLVTPISFLLPSYTFGSRKKWYLRLGMIAYDLLSCKKSLASHRSFTREKLQLLEPGLQQQQLLGGFSYQEVQAVFPERLTLANLLSAEQAGAVVRNYTAVTKIHVKDGQAIGIDVTDTVRKKTATYYGKIIINAAGPWVDAVNALTPQQIPPQIGGTKGSHIVVKPWKNAPRHAIYLEAHRDQRPLFIVPWRGYILIGTTDIPYKDNLDTVYPTKQEVQYFISETNFFFPQARLTPKKVIHSYAGVRPLPTIRKEAPGDIPRSHIIKDHANEGISHFLSIISGKITTHRSVAQETVDYLAKKYLPSKNKSQTAQLPLVGGEIQDINAYRTEHLATMKQEYNLSAAQGENLISLFGTKHTAVLKLLHHNPALRALISHYHPDILAEVYYCLQHEYATSIGDFLLRRTGIGSGEGQGLDCAPKVARIFAEHFRWSKTREEQEIKQYQQEIKLRYTAH